MRPAMCEERVRERERVSVSDMSEREREREREEDALNKTAASQVLTDTLQNGMRSYYSNSNSVCL